MDDSSNDMDLSVTSTSVNVIRTRTKTSGDRRFRSMPPPFQDFNDSLNSVIERISSMEPRAPPPPIRYHSDFLLGLVRHPSEGSNIHKKTPSPGRRTRADRPDRRDLFSLVDDDASKNSRISSPDNSCDSGISSLDDDSPAKAVKFSLVGIERLEQESPVKTLSFSDESESDDDNNQSLEHPLMCSSLRADSNTNWFFSNTARRACSTATSSTATSSTPTSSTPTSSTLRNLRTSETACDKKYSQRAPVSSSVSSHKRSCEDPYHPYARKRRSYDSPVAMVTLPESPASPEVVASVLDGDVNDTIGDFSRPHCLPTVTGKHQDLKCISAHTMAQILTGQYSHSIAQCNIIDCRYPFEFEGGHIRTASNIWERGTMLKEYLQSDQHRRSHPTKRNIIVFHCEFSSERGPKMCRFLRQMDRDANKDSYPGLYYPEIYVLEGGYKAFYGLYPGLCDPQTYKPMLHPDHINDVKHFRVKSKSWVGEKPSKSRVMSRRHLLM